MEVVRTYSGRNMLLFQLATQLYLCMMQPEFRYANTYLSLPHICNAMPGFKVAQDVVGHQPAPPSHDGSMVEGETVMCPA